MVAAQDFTAGGFVATKAEYDRLSNMPEYEEGMNACLGGMAASFNHYPAGTEKQKAFALGWHETDKEMPK